MISKRDNLLNRPWQERKFENHKRKVQTALPVVDNKSPPFRGHVAIKLKKSQKETERIRSIEKDNFFLLQRLNYIMKTKWVDNYLPPQPKFLNRVPMFHTETNLSVEVDDDDKQILIDENLNDTKIKLRKLICPACTPQKPIEPKIPEERVPWEPTKKSVRTRSKSVPAKKSCPLPFIKQKPHSASISTNFSISASLKDTSRTEESPLLKTDKMRFASSEDKDNKSSSNNSCFKLHRSKSKSNLLPVDFLVNEPQKIILSRGSLKLALNFPPDTSVIFKDGRLEKRLTRVPCHCQKPSISV